MKTRFQMYILDNYAILYFERVGILVFTKEKVFAIIVNWKMPNIDHDKLLEGSSMCGNNLGSIQQAYT